MKKRKKKIVFVRTVMVNSPDFMYWLSNSLSIIAHFFICKIRKKSFKDFMTRKRIVNEVRKTCRDYSEKDNQNRKTLKCWTAQLENAVRVRVRFNKKATENEYMKFKDTVEIHTSVTTALQKEKGFLYFDVLVFLHPKYEFEGSRTTVSIGTGFDGLTMWDWVQYPHCLVVAETGQGKSVFVRYLLLGLFTSQTQVWLVDGKMVDYYAYRDKFDRYISNEVSNIEQVLEFVRDFRMAMLERQQKLKTLGLTNFADEPSMNSRIMILEEYIVLLDCMNKKQREAFEEDIRAILLLGRAMGFDLLVTMQRGDTAYIKGAMRDNFMCRVLLGSFSDTSSRMMFDTPLKSLEVGKAWIQQGDRIEVAAIPYYGSLDLPEKH